MVDDVCGVGLIKYCKAKCITFKEYPKPLTPIESTISNPTSRRKKIPPKSNDNVVSDHETSTSCSEGEDDVAYIKSIKTAVHAVDLKKASTSSTAINTTSSLPKTEITKVKIEKTEMTESPLVVTLD